MKTGIELSRFSKIKYAFYLFGKALSEKELLATISDIANRQLEKLEVSEIIESALIEDLLEKSSGLFYLKTGVIAELDNFYNLLKVNKKPVSLEEIEPLISGTASEYIKKLEIDQRFIKIKGFNVWLLTEWHIVNSDIYEYLEMSEIGGIPLDDLETLFVNVKSSLTKVFIPQYDSRFSLNDKLVSINNGPNINPLDEKEMYPKYLKNYKNKIQATSKSIEKQLILLQDLRTNIQRELLEIVNKSSTSSLTKEEIDNQTKEFERLIKKQSFIQKVIDDSKQLLVLVGEMDEKKD